MDIGHTTVGVGGSAGRIVLHGVDMTFAVGQPDLISRQGVRQVKRHQGLEMAAGRNLCGDALPVGAGGGRTGNRLRQIGHHDGAPEIAGGVGNGMGQLVSVPQVQMPVIGTGEGNTVNGHQECLIFREPGLMGGGHCN